MQEIKKLEYSDFNVYPHYVYATAFLVNGELADYKIQNAERDWGLRTFRGSPWENEVWQHGFIDKDWDLSCEYNKILVNNDNEHNEAFEKLEDWLFDTFKIYEKSGLTRWRSPYKEIKEKTDRSITTGYGTGECCHLYMQELQAINKKVKELGVDIVEEDIKILKSIIKVHNDFLKGCSKETISNKEIIALEHLLNRYKELEEENLKLKEKWERDCHKIHEIVKEEHKIKTDYIPTSVIEEKIKWLKVIADNGINAVRFACSKEDEIERIERQKNISTMIEILQEILEGRKIV